MSTWLVAVIGVVYFYVAIEQAYKGDMGTALMFAGYAVANGGVCFIVK
jgi:hypothetical protein